MLIPKSPVEPLSLVEFVKPVDASPKSDWLLVDLTRLPSPLIQTCMRRSIKGVFLQLVPYPIRGVKFSYARKG